MSLKAADSECEMQLARAAIHVKIGNITITAILDNSCVINAVHRKVIKRICSQDKDGETYGEVENVELDFTIDGRSVTAVFRVLGNLNSDMTLGKEFFQSTKAHVQLKWFHQDELVITNMVENDADFRAVSGGSDDSSKEAESSKKETETAEPIVESEGKKKESKRTDEVNNYTPSTSSEAASISNDLQLLTLGDSKVATNGSKKDKFVKIFIARRDLCDMLSGEWLAYYAIYSPQENIFFVTGEVFTHREKTPVGFHLEAFHNAFEEADKHGIKHLHLLSENEEAIRLMKEHQKKYEKYGDIEPEQYPRGLYLPNDLINYYTACFGIPGYKSLKFEYISFQDETYKEMVYARKRIQEYIDTTPM